MIPHTRSSRWAGAEFLDTGPEEGRYEVAARLSPSTGSDAREPPFGSEQTVKAEISGT